MSLCKSLALRAIPHLVVSLLALGWALPSGATLADTPVAKTAKPSKAVKPGSSRQQLNNQAKGLALATETASAISEAQLDIATRVLTGPADCEFNQHISVLPVPGQAGHFHVGFKGQRYTMRPEETNTGAVRLEDKKAGVVWLQISSKSMLMNAKVGQRMVDDCKHAEQRTDTTSLTTASLGILPGAVPTPTAAAMAAAAATAAAAAATPAATAASDAAAAAGVATTAASAAATPAATAASDAATAVEMSAPAAAGPATPASAPQ